MTDIQKPLNIHDVPGLGDRRTKALKIQGATDWWFYPAIFAIAAALIFASLGFEAFAPGGGGAQKAERDGKAYVYNAAALAEGIAVSEGHLRHVTRDMGVSARSIRVGVRPGLGAPTPSSIGAALRFDPSDAAALVGRPIHVEVTVRRISVTTAAALAVSLQSSAPTIWTTAAIPMDDGVMAFDLPALDGPTPNGLGLWLVSDKTDYNYGVEISRIAITPIG